MRSNLATIQARIALNLQQAGTDILLTWSEYTGGTPDPVTGANVGGMESRRTKLVKGLVHSAEATSSVRQFAEIEVGDIIVDLAPDAPIDGKTGLRFTIDGQVYCQKTVGEKLTKMWDVVQANVRLYRTVLLKKML
jgi:hypothetical protein